MHGRGCRRRAWDAEPPPGVSFVPAPSLQAAASLHPLVPRPVVVCSGRRSQSLRGKCPWALPRRLTPLIHVSHWRKPCIPSPAWTQLLLKFPSIKAAFQPPRLGDQHGGVEFRSDPGGQPGRCQDRVRGLLRSSQFEDSKVHRPPLLRGQWDPARGSLSKQKVQSSSRWHPLSGGRNEQAGSGLPVLEACSGRSSGNQRWSHW